MADDDAPNEGGTPTDPPSDSTTNGDPRGQRQDTSGRDQADPEQQQQQSKTFTQADVDRLIDKRTEQFARKYAGFDELKQKASKFDELEAAKKSEVEKLNEQNAGLQAKLKGYEVAEIRRSAATDAGLPAKYAKYITASDESGALAQAKELANDLKSATEPPKPADLKQGARPQPPPTGSRDDLIRRMAGHG